MICAGRDCVYAIFFVLCICAQSTAAIGKGDKEGNPVRPSPGAFPGVATPTEFQWNEHSKLSWEDFRGGISTMDDEAAAATHCGIGFKTNTRTSGDKPEIIVYNTFYVNKSWVRADAKLPEILLHEQGHFDLCEIYTRKLRERMKKFDFNARDIKLALMSIYNEVSNEYEKRQQAYERETIHGTNLSEQKRWVEMIAREL